VVTAKEGFVDEVAVGARIDEDADGGGTELALEDEE
jgi:hypothetical protein